ncbi:tetratricopeptide repeat protein [Magnetofaba australis]|uniref:Uncharacterized protein n=1 Tax=Magnetofaba australis IT-1 TaxID=1434232 RepID=A0A1Y2K6B7_9PROT|nr:tetratricopeptide repeat protein [Magnetofaba australis]OSM05070.1 hypothetical protein MAIT1_03208 [Magnetofaba australis IT-1]
MIVAETRISLSITRTDNGGWRVEILQESEPLARMERDGAALQPLRAALEAWTQARRMAERGDAQMAHNALTAVGVELRAAFLGEAALRIDALLAAESTVLLGVGTTDPESLSWPWETLADANGAPLSRNPQVKFRRLATGVKETARCCITLPNGPLRALLCAVDADPVSAPQRHIAAEQLFFQTAGAARGERYLEACERADLSDLKSRINRMQPQLLHLSAPVKRDESGAALLGLAADDASGLRFVDAHTLNQDALQSSGVRGIILSGATARDESHAPEGALLELGAQLSALGAPLVVVLPWDGGDKRSRAFLTALYGKLIGGSGVDAAVRAARDAVCSADWAAPALFASAVGDGLYNVSDAAPRVRPEFDQAAYPPPPGVILPIPAPFFGRRRQLGPLLARMRHGGLQVLLLTGVEGLGKSALTARMAWSLSQEGLEPMVVKGSPANPISVHRVIEAVAQKLLDKGFDEEFAILDSPDLDLSKRLEFVVGLINQRLPLALVLDGLDYGMDGDSRHFLSPAMAALYEMLITRISGRSRLLLSSRCAPVLKSGAKPASTFLHEALEEPEDSAFYKRACRHDGLMRRINASDLSWDDIEALRQLQIASFAPAPLILGWADSQPAESLRAVCQQALSVDQVSLDLSGPLTPGMDPSGQILSQAVLADLSPEDRQLLATWALARTPMDVASLNAMCDESRDLSDAELELWRESGWVCEAGSGPEGAALWMLEPFLRDALNASDTLAADLRQSVHAKLAEMTLQWVGSERASAYGHTWFDLLFEARGHAHGAGDASKFLELSDSLASALLRHGHVDEALRLNNESRRLTNHPLPLLRMGRIFLETGRPEEAQRWFELALKEGRERAEPGIEGEALQALASLKMAAQDIGGAAHLLGDALELMREAQDSSGQAAILNQLAAIELHQGDRASAIGRLEQSERLWKKARNYPARAATLHQLGMLALEDDERDIAMKHLEKALQFYRLAGAEQELAMLLPQLAALYYQRGNTEAAREYYEEALPMLELGPFEQQRSYTLHQLGAIDLGDGKLDDAEPRLLEALKLKQRLEDRRGEAAALFQLARLAKERDKMEEAMQLVGVCYRIDQQLGSPDADEELRIYLEFAQFLEIAQDEAEQLMAQQWGEYLHDRGHALLKKAFPQRKTIPIQLSPS